jgi:hypothetical protein
LSVIGLFLLSGCSSIDEAIEDLTTRKVTVSHVVFDGTPQKETLSEGVVESEVINAGDTVARTIENLGDFVDSLDCFTSDLAPALVSLSGKITNSTDYGTTVIISIGPSGSIDDPGKWAELGSVYVGAGESLLFEESSGLNEKAEKVDNNLFTFFSDHPEIQQNPLDNGADLFISVDGPDQSRVQVKFINFTANPVFRIERPMSSDMIGGYSKRVKSIGSVALTGQVKNYGSTEVRFMLVISEYDSEVNFATGLVADGFIDPGETRQVSAMVVDGGLPRIKNAMYDMLDGDLISGNIYLLSDTTVHADVHSLKIESKLTVGL